MTKARDTHRSFALAGFNRVNAMPGVSLFDSEIKHNRFITLRVSRAVRDRDLHHDWLHAEGAPLVEVAMSEAQFGALVSSFGQGEGVPVTLTELTGEPIEEPPYAPRTEESLREIDEATDKLYGTAVAEVRALRKAFDAGAGRKEMGEKLRGLEATLENAKPNNRYVAETFTKHIETVVTKARADIEATVALGATRGLAIGDDVRKLLPGTVRDEPRDREP